MQKEKNTLIVIIQQKVKGKYCIEFNIKITILKSQTYKYFVEKQVTVWKGLMVNWSQNSVPTCSLVTSLQKFSKIN